MATTRAFVVFQDLSSPVPSPTRNNPKAQPDSPMSAALAAVLAEKENLDPLTGERSVESEDGDLKKRRKKKSVTLVATAVDAEASATAVIIKKPLSACITVVGGKGAKKGSMVDKVPDAKKMKKSREDSLSTKPAIVVEPEAPSGPPSNAPAKGKRLIKKSSMSSSSKSSRRRIPQPQLVDIVEEEEVVRSHTADDDLDAAARLLESLCISPDDANTKCIDFAELDSADAKVTPAYKDSVEFFFNEGSVKSDSPKTDRLDFFLPVLSPTKRAFIASSYTPDSLTSTPQRPKSTKRNSNLLSTPERTLSSAFTFSSPCRSSLGTGMLKLAALS